MIQAKQTVYLLTMAFGHLCDEVVGIYATPESAKTTAQNHANYFYHGHTIEWGDDLASPDTIAAYEGTTASGDALRYDVEIYEVEP